MTRAIANSNPGVLVIVAVLLATSTLRAEEDKKPGEPDKPAAQPSAEEIAAWVGQLDDARYLAREQATRNLLEAGPAALDTLLTTANGERPEPSDRAVWIMRRMARSRDDAQAIAALEHIVQLSNRPALVEKADIELAERSLVACQSRLSPLGAEIALEPTQIDLVTVVPMLHVRLGDKWKGKPEDLKCLADLRRQQYFRLDGKAINDTVVKYFVDKESLGILHLWNVQVSADMVDELKAHHPGATVFVRGEAMMGVAAESRPGGVAVTRVEPESGAATAGIIAGDIINSMDGQPLPDFDRLTARIAQHRPGDSVELEFDRGGERKKVTVLLGRRPEGE